MDDIDREHDLSHLSDAEYRDAIRRIEQLASCPCTTCEARCWDTIQFGNYEPYRKWWRREHGVRGK